MVKEKAVIRWNDKSKEAKKLVSLFVEGHFTRDTYPKEIYHNHPELFSNYAEEQGGNAVARIKMKCGWVVKKLKVKNQEEGMFICLLLIIILLLEPLIVDCCYCCFLRILRVVFCCRCFCVERCFVCDL